MWGLQIKEEGQRRVVLQNFLLDRGKVERTALVQVTSPNKLHHKLAP